MKRTQILALLLAVVVMLMMAIILLPQDDNQEEEAVVTQTVIVAKQNIPAYTEITAEMLDTIEYPEELIPAGAATEMDEVIGSKPLTELSAQEVIMHNHLFSEGDTIGGLSAMLEDGMRAMSVRVDEVTGVSNLLRVGNRVDVIVVLTDAANNKFSEMLLENIEVVALDTTLTGNPLNDEGKPYYTTVTLSIEPQAAVNLAYAENEGSVYLIGRPQNDEGSASTSSFRIEAGIVQ